MKISIIIPVYNVEDYIRATLNSILKQTLTDFEVIIVNDDSPDNSQVIIDEFCEKDSRFKSYKELSGGVSSARNYGLEHASGEYVLFVDGDDIIPPKSGHSENVGIICTVKGSCDYSEIKKNIFEKCRVAIIICDVNG